MSPRERRRGGAFTSASSSAPALPPDLVLEIVARTDAATILRCAACCKPLCRDIASPAFLRRVCHGGAGAVVPPRQLGFLQSHDNFTIFISAAAMPRGSPPLPRPPFSLAHPATPAAARLSERHLAPFVSRAGAGAADLLARYEPVTSRGGLAVLRRRRHHAGVPREAGICVYDPLTARRAFLPDPPEMADYSPGYEVSYSYVLLTASDGIGRRFLLLAADFTMLMYPASSIDVLTMSSSDATGGGGEWSPVTTVKSHRCRSHCSSLHPYCSAVIIGGTVHWLMHGGRDLFHVLTYDVGAATAGSIELPVSRLPESYRENCDANLRLASSPEGMLTVCHEPTSVSKSRKRQGRKDVFKQG